MHYFFFLRQLINAVGLIYLVAVVHYVSCKFSNHIFLSKLLFEKDPTFSKMLRNGKNSFIKCIYIVIGM